MGRQDLDRRTTSQWVVGSNRRDHFIVTFEPKASRDRRLGTKQQWAPGSVDFERPRKRRTFFRGDGLIAFVLQGPVPNEHTVFPNFEVHSVDRDRPLLTAPAEYQAPFFSAS